MKKMCVGKMIISLLIPLMVGGASAALTYKAMATYGTMNKPPLSPPAWLFPVAWTILYVMMGLAFYFVWVADTDPRKRKIAIWIYVIQLIMNFMWPIAFFNWGMYLFAFVWLIILWALVIFCAFKFFAICKMAGCLLIPYAVWLTFAAYLNIGAYILN